MLELPMVSVLMEPHSLEELSQVPALRERKVVVLGMTILNLSRHSGHIRLCSRRNYAIDGHPQFISCLLVCP